MINALFQARQIYHMKYGQSVLKMASDSGENRNNDKSTFSFKFKKTKPAVNLVEKNKEYIENDKNIDSGKDFILSAEGKRLKSINPKDENKELIIPCKPRDNTLFPSVKNELGNMLDKEAAEEIMKDLSKNNNDPNEISNGYAIPLLAKTHLTTDEDQLDTSHLPTESSLEDYEAIPVTQFGAAMLRGMGWKKGEAIGGINKGLTVPIEYIPRSHGLGLGAEREQVENKKKKRRKPGDEKKEQYSGPIIEENGKVRHFRGLDEKVGDKRRKKHKEDNFDSEKKAKRDIAAAKSEYDRKGTSEKDKHDISEADHFGKDRDCDKDDLCWMAPLIRVRIISKEFKKGKYFQKKVVIQDVLSRTTCLCKTDEGRLLDDIPQTFLETVIPRGDSKYVLFVLGKYKGLIGEVVKTDSSKQLAIVQILRDKHITKTHYDNISEYLGDIHKE